MGQGIVPARGRSAVLACAFILSGATGLAYEVLWSRYLGAILGNSSYAHAVVLATFLGGLALGNALLGRLADRVRDPLRLYGWLELGIGALAALSPPLLTALAGAYVGLARGLDLPPAGLKALEAGVVVLALLPATLLMGGTLPALGAYLTDSLARLQRAVSWLYFLNSAGAAAGALVTGFALIPALGLDRATTLFAA
ncbi:MAG: spermidine synthase, partial [Candidatus Sericytochromatia bacterium]|nr:spermidine synthase [Candidatus Tanganyikabacteria bacterium]